jgi:hypothetical protein
MKILINLLFTFILFPILVGHVGSPQSIARGQMGEIWEPTDVIGGDVVKAMWPIITADPYDRLHVFWVQPYENDDSRQAAIMHRMKDEHGWNDENDIVIRDDWAYSHPYAAISKVTAYLIWAEWSGLFFSRAAIDSMDDASEWEIKQQISLHTGIDQSRIIVDREGNMSVIYSRLSSGLGGDGNIYYLTSRDGGTNWTEPIAVTRVTDGALRANLGVRMTIDQVGILHVVWSEEVAPSWIGRTVYYSRYQADIESWTEPVVLSGDNPGYTLWEAAPSITTDSNGILHVVWVCGRKTYRCYRYSNNHGESWSSIQHILDSYESLAGWDDIVADEEGGIHLVAQLRSPNNVYHVTKPSDGEWENPFPAYTSREASQAHYMSAVLTNGNILHIVSTSYQGGAIWYGSGILQLRSSHAIFMPTTQTKNIEFPYPIEPKDSIPAISPTSSFTVDQLEEAIYYHSGTTPISIGTLFSISLLLLMAILTKKARRR